MPLIAVVHAGDVAAVGDGASGLALPLPLPGKAGTPGEAAFLDDVLVVVAVGFLFAEGIVGGDELQLVVVVVAHQREAAGLVAAFVSVNGHPLPFHAGQQGDAVGFIEHVPPVALAHRLVEVVKAQGLLLLAFQGAEAAMLVVAQRQAVVVGVGEYDAVDFDGNRTILPAVLAHPASGLASCFQQK
ncbi:hypothetical protein [Pokkaliibacter plantistimulans]|uniref:hypothetical protein n=1 Tax=Pokkaliibacter plantistimulans TaxID=1635171 RepID=UPI00398F96C7